MSDLLVAIGTRGILYPSNSFDDGYFDISLLWKMALTTDDLWFKVHEIRLCISVYKISEHTKIPYTIGGSQKHL